MEVTRSTKVSVHHIGSSEALVGQSPRSTFVQLFIQQALGEKTDGDEGFVSTCMCHRCGEFHSVAVGVATMPPNPVTCRPFRANDSDVAPANIRTLLPQPRARG